MKRWVPLLLALIGVLGAAAAIVTLSGGYDGPTAEELSAHLDQDLAAFRRDRDATAPFAARALRPLATRAGAHLPANRPEPGASGTTRDGAPDPKAALASLCGDEARREAAEGRLLPAAELLAALIGYGEDAHVGREYDAPFHPAVEAGEKALRDLTADRVLAGEALDLAIANERERLARAKATAAPAAAWRYRLLEAQVLLRRLVREEPLGAEVDWSGPVDRLFGLTASPPGRADYLAAWNGIRVAFRPLLVAADRDDEAGMEEAARVIRDAAAGAPDSVFSRVASAILVYGDLARDSYEDWLRHREARLLGMLLLREKQRRGAFPENLESIRVEEIPASPHGGAWRLGLDLETKQPAVFLDGGRTYSYQVLAPQEGDFHADRETKPLFSFR